MRIVFLHHLYRDLVHEIKAQAENQRLHSEGIKTLLNKANPNAHGLELSLRELGVDMHALPANADLYLSKWAEERSIDSSDTDALLIQWLQELKPDLVYYGPHYTGLLRRIKAEVGSVQKVVIAANSPFHDLSILKLCDGVVGCIPSVVTRLCAQGLPAHYVPHGFPAHVLDELAPAEPHRGLYFLGSIVREKDFHEAREQLLLALQGARLPLHILTPGKQRLAQEPWATYAKQLAYVLSKPMRASEGLRNMLTGNKLFEKLLSLRSMPTHPVHTALRGVMEAPLFGMAMFGALRDAQVVLNTHIDYAGPDASNMRLFEATGVGGCLLTDWKPNLHEFFEDGHEVLSYKDAVECVSKAKELLQNDTLAAELRVAAQQRVLREHTLRHRAPLYQSAFWELLNK